MTRLRVAATIAISALLVLVAPAVAQWPTTCIEANDSFEYAAGRYENVGIYQRVYGDIRIAEAVCQQEHGADIRASFAWAMQGPAPAPDSTPDPSSHPDWHRVWEVANARSSDGLLAYDIADSVISRGTVDAFLRGTDDGVQYGRWSCEWRTATCPLAPERPPEPPPTSGPWLDAGLDRAWAALKRSHFGSELLRVRGADTVAKIVWADDLPGNATAGWAPNTRTIGINPRYRYEQPEALAPVIAHELWHVVNTTPSTSFDQCVAEEVRAFIVQAAVWMDLRPAVARAGTVLEQAHEHMLTVWLNDPGDPPGPVVLTDVSGYPGLRNLALYSYDYATICAA